MTLTASACGTTEGASNDEIEPGSGELGPGDAVDPNAEVPLDDEPVLSNGDDLDVDATTPSTLALTSGAQCGTPDATREIEALPARMFRSMTPVADRAETLQMGRDPSVVDLLARASTYSGAAVTRIVCVDDGAATIAVSFEQGAAISARAGSVMLVDGSWRVTLHAFCRWTGGELCNGEIAAQAHAALSPALREHIAR